MPAITIGLPVFNGENYLREALDSLLAQTWTDFELILCDNGSTDATERICRAYAALDSRLKYFRNRRNIGAAANFNLAVRLATAPYFKWMAHDDRLHPEFLAVCLQALEKNPAAVLACSAVGKIDAQGRPAGDYRFPMRLADVQPHRRFADIIQVRHPCTLVFGLIRRRILEQTPLIAPFTGSDRCLLAELSLYGPFVEVPGELFQRRDHPGNSCHVYEDPRQRNLWFDPRRRGGIYLPEWRIVLEYRRRVRRSPLPRGEKWRCYRQIERVARQRRQHLLLDLLLAGRDLLQGNPLGQQMVTFCKRQMHRAGIDPYALGKRQDSKNR